MKVLDTCKNYFQGFNEILNCKKNDAKTNALAFLKVLSYFTLIIPAGFAVAGLISLAGRVTKKTEKTPQDQAISDQAKKTILIEAKTPSIPQEAQIKENQSSSVSTLDQTEISIKNPKKVELSQVLETYEVSCRPNRNGKNLEKYSQSDDYKRHAQTARIYYNASQLTEEDALKVVFQREPTNIAMGADQYNQPKLKELFGYEKGIFNDKDAKKADGSLFKELPNTATVYSETYMWDPPGGDHKKEIACLSVPAPALDSVNQPHYQYYMSKGKLDAKKYENEMKVLFKSIENAVRDHKDTAFDGQGIKRVVLSRFGQGVFLGALNSEDRLIANKAYKKQLSEFLKRMKDSNLEIVMSEYSEPQPADVWHDKMIIGDIVRTAQEGDFIVNAWDPHSAPGNGNDADHSFDGAMGRSTGILLTQTSWLNDTLKDKNSLVGLK